MADLGSQDAEQSRLRRSLVSQPLDLSVPESQLPLKLVLSIEHFANLLVFLIHCLPSLLHLLTRVDLRSSQVRLSERLKLLGHACTGALRGLEALFELVVLVK